MFHISPTVRSPVAGAAVVDMLPVQVILLRMSYLKSYFAVDELPTRRVFDNIFDALVNAETNLHT